MLLLWLLCLIVKKMATKVALQHLKSLFKDDDSQIVLNKGESRIELILRTKLETLRKEAFLSNGDVDSFVEKVIEWSGLLSCNSCFKEISLKENCKENDDCYHDNKQSVLDNEHREIIVSMNFKKKFTLCCIHILFILDEELTIEYDNVKGTAPTALLGANDKKLILAALQMIIGLGFYLNLEQGIGSLIAERSCFGALLEKEKATEDIDLRFLFICVKALCYLMNNKEFGQLITTKYLGDVFGCLMQLGYQRKKAQGEKNQTKKEGIAHNFKKMNADCEEKSDICHHKKAWCKNELKILLDSTYQPLVLRELLMLQGFGRQKKQNESVVNAPKWLQKQCAMFLTNKLMQHGGLRNILKAIFEEYDMDGNETIMRFNMIGYLISNCPFQAKSISEYYTLMSEQILSLIELNGIDEKTKYMYMQASSSCISWMLKKDVTLTTKLIIKPLFTTFHKMASKESRDEDIAICEDEINKSIEKIHKIFIPNPTSQMVAALSTISTPLFEVYMLLQRGVSYFKSLTHDLLIYILQNSSDEKSLEVLVEILLTKDKRQMQFSNEQRTISNFENEDFDNQLRMLSCSKDSNILLEQQNFSTEERVDGILNLLASLKEQKIIAKFFLMLLKNLAKSSEGHSKSSTDQPLSNIDKVIFHLKETIPTVSMIAAICDKFGDKILHDRAEIMAFIKVTMECCLSFDHGDQSDDLKMEMLSMSLAVLSLMVNTKESSGIYDELKSFLEVLEQIENSIAIESIVQSASSLRIAICTHGAINRQTQRDKCFGAASDELYDKAIIDLVDPLLPTRAHAIVQLSSLIEKKNPKATENVDKLIDIFLENLYHDDSYIYLASIKALTSVSQHYHEIVIPRLAREFANFSNVTKESKIGSRSNGNHKNGKMMSPEKRMKIGEALMKSIKACGPILPRYVQIIMSSLLTGVKDDDGDIRASSLSNIGEACKLLRFAVGSMINELVDCLSSVIRFDKKANVRRAALSVIIMLLDGLSGETFQAIGGSLKDLYQILKLILHADVDDVTKSYAENALGKLNLVTKDFLFPKQILTKKINILQPPDVSK